jgi:hypothetical protein
MSPKKAIAPEAAL